MAHVIGITGLAGAGKDTLAAAMARQFARMGEPVCLAGFADPIREVCKAVGLDPHTRETKEVKQTFSLDVFCDNLQHAIDTVLRNRMTQDNRTRLYCLMVEHTAHFVSEPVGSEYTQYINISPREFMQVFGTEAGQAIHRRVWVDMATTSWRARDGYVLVTDFRFPHEAPALDTVVTVINQRIQRVNNHVSEDLPYQLTSRWTPKVAGKKNYYAFNNASRECLGMDAEVLAGRIHLARIL